VAKKKLGSGGEFRFNQKPRLILATKIQGKKILCKKNSHGIICSNLKICGGN
jgi:hypothetical protein